jgi:hypothetical protein
MVASTRSSLALQPLDVAEGRVVRLGLEVHDDRAGGVQLGRLDPVDALRTLASKGDLEML